ELVDQRGSERPGVADNVVPQREDVVAAAVVQQRLAVHRRIFDVLLGVPDKEVVVLRRSPVDLEVALISVGVCLLGIRRVVEQGRARGLRKHAQNLQRGRADAGNARRRTHFLAGAANRGLGKVGRHWNRGAGIVERDAQVGEIPCPLRRRECGDRVGGSGGIEARTLVVGKEEQLVLLYGTANRSSKQVPLLLDRRAVHGGVGTEIP